jgi:hypothetical protein
MAANWKLSAHLLRHTCLVSVRWHNLLHYGRSNRWERAAAFNRTRVRAAVPTSTGHTFMLCNISVADIKRRSSTHARAHIETVSISWRTLARWKSVRREMHYRQGGFWFLPIIRLIIPSSVFSEPRHWVNVPREGVWECCHRVWSGSLQLFLTTTIDLEWWWTRLGHRQIQP